MLISPSCVSLIPCSESRSLIWTSDWCSDLVPVVAPWLGFKPGCFQDSNLPVRKLPDIFHCMNLFPDPEPAPVASDRPLPLQHRGLLLLQQSVLNQVLQVTHTRTVALPVSTCTCSRRASSPSEPTTRVAVRPRPPRPAAPTSVTVTTPPTTRPARWPPRGAAGGLQATAAWANTSTTWT